MLVVAGESAKLGGEETLVLTLDTALAIADLSAIVFRTKFKSTSGSFDVSLKDGNDKVLYKFELPAGKHIYRISLDDAVLGVSGLDVGALAQSAVGALAADTGELNWDFSALTAAYALATLTTQSAALVTTAPSWTFFPYDATTRKFNTANPLTQQLVPIANASLQAYQIPVNKVV